MPSGALPVGECLFGIVGANADDPGVSASTMATQIHKQAIRILLFKSQYLVRSSVMKLQRRYDSRSLPHVARWQYGTLGLHDLFHNSIILARPTLSTSAAAEEPRVIRKEKLRVSISVSAGQREMTLG